MKTLIDNIRKWAEDRNIIKGSTPIKQHDKLVEEVLELRDAIVELKFCRMQDSSYVRDEIKDAIGDCTVCLINLAAMHDVDFVDCVQSAYDEIKDRKGMMIDGKFVKQSDLMTTEDVVSQITQPH